MNPEFLALSLIILLFSVIVHEVMHGLLALKFGDHTAQAAGRLTLNPIPHIDPIGTVLLPLMFYILPALTNISPGFMIGWAKPVPVNPLHFTDIKRGEFFVAIAGVCSNFGLAIIAAILYHVIQIFFGYHYLLSPILQFSVSINLMLGVFNLLPIPPLDGSKVLVSQLSYKLAREYEKISSYGVLIILFLLYFNILGLILRFILIPLHILLGVPPV